MIPIPEQFTTAEMWAVAKPFIIFVIAMVIYAVFIFKFYRFVGRRDIFHLRKKEKKGSGLHPVLYVLGWIFLYPFFAFVWFIIMSVLLAFLAKEQAVQNILLVSVALITSVRITAYYHEDLSKDLAKMLPFALLGIMLVDITYFSFSASLGMVKQMPALWETMAYYLVFLIVIEFVLRIGHGIWSFWTKPRLLPEKTKK
jgi:hypothetical protein